jgi:hypothetical protein
MSHRRSTASSILEVFSLNPLPYPVLFILALIFFFLGFQFYSDYEEAVESTEDSINWILIATPIVLLFAVKWLSGVENPERIFGFGLSPYERQRFPTNYFQSDGGSSPWGVALIILLVLVLVQFQSTVQEFFG